MEALARDFAYALRKIRRSPGFALAVVGTLALGIGATAAFFSLFDRVLLRPLPYRQPDRLVAVWERMPSKNLERNVVSPANFLDWQKQSDAFERMAAVYDLPVNLVDGGSAEELQAQLVTGDLFGIFGVRAARGRTIGPADVEAGAEPVVVLRHEFWERHFGGDPAVVGKKLTLTGTVFTVVGVMPPRFQLPGSRADLWGPLAIAGADRTGGGRGRFLRAFGQLRPGVTPERAQQQLNTVARRLEQQYPDYNAGWGVQATPLAEDVNGRSRGALVVLFGAVCTLLLLACANIASLLLGRMVARRKEFAIRSSLGAQPRQLALQLLAESVVLSLVGGAVGLLVAVWLASLVGSMIPEGILPAGEVLRVDMRAALFAFVVSALVGVLVGLLPALSAARGDSGEVFKQSGQRTTSTREQTRTRQTVVAAEVALALVLLVGAGLTIKSFWRLQRTDPGFRAERVTSIRVLLPGGQYSAPQQARFFTEAMERIRGVPGVSSAGAVGWLPFSGKRSSTTFAVSGRPAPRIGEEPVTDVRVVAGDYFRTLRIPLRRGRLFDSRDGAEGVPVALVNETMARRYLGGRDPVGQQLTYTWNTPTTVQVVGVVGDVLEAGMNAQAEPAVYRPVEQEPRAHMHLLVQSTSGNTPVNAVRARIREMDSQLPLDDVQELPVVLASSLAQPRLYVLLLGTFAVAALALAGLGVYGIISTWVAERQRDVGIRVALGSSPQGVVKLVVGQSLKPLLAGLAAGLVIALAGSRVIASLLYGVSTTDAATYALVAIFLALVALAASYIPARRASRLDPAVVLRDAE